jgi:transposase-like protein
MRGNPQSQNHHVVVLRAGEVQTRRTVRCRIHEMSSTLEILEQVCDQVPIVFDDQYTHDNFRGGSGHIAYRFMRSACCASRATLP